MMKHIRTLLIVISVGVIILYFDYYWDMSFELGPLHTEWFSVVGIGLPLVIAAGARFFTKSQNVFWNVLLGGLVIVICLVAWVITLFSGLSSGPLF
jgi:hypothetical protein